MPGSEAHECTDDCAQTIYAVAQRIQDVVRRPTGPRLTLDPLGRGLAGALLAPRLAACAVPIGAEYRDFSLSKRHVEMIVDATLLHSYVHSLGVHVPRHAPPGDMDCPPYGRDGHPRSSATMAWHLLLAELSGRAGGGEHRPKYPPDPLTGRHAEAHRLAVCATLHALGSFREGGFVHVYRGGADLATPESRVHLYRMLFGVPRGAPIIPGPVYDRYIICATSDLEGDLTPPELESLELAIGLAHATTHGQARPHPDAHRAGPLTREQREHLMARLRNVLMCDAEAGDPQRRAHVAILNLYREHPAMIPSALTGLVDSLLTHYLVLSSAPPPHLVPLPIADRVAPMAVLTVVTLGEDEVEVHVRADHPRVRDAIVEQVSEATGIRVQRLQFINDNEASNKVLITELLRSPATAALWCRSAALGGVLYELEWTGFVGAASPYVVPPMKKTFWLKRGVVEALRAKYTDLLLIAGPLNLAAFIEDVNAYLDRGERNEQYLRDVAGTYSGKAAWGYCGRYPVIVAGEDAGAVDRPVHDRVPRGVLRALRSISECDTYAMEPEELRDKLVEHLEGYRNSWSYSIRSAMPFYWRSVDTKNLYRNPKGLLPIPAP